MSKKYDKEKLENEGILEFESEIYRLDEKKSQAWLSLPFPALRKANWKKDDTYKITIERKEAKTE
jgi:hypothetical protein